jgi:beta-phosphoglucomutase-like phosphatase (HAD superfamily)
MIKAVIFDVDGTLVDSVDLNARAWKETFREFGKDIPFQEIRDLFQRVLADGKKIALASSAIGKELQTYKKVANIADLLDAETSADDAEQSKPHPDIFVAALERLDDPRKEETLVIGEYPPMTSKPRQV